VMMMCWFLNLFFPVRRIADLVANWVFSQSGCIHWIERRDKIVALIVRVRRERERMRKIA
ncbi:MAG: hypothetical protein CMH83_06200, partial [Nocardioides sp.]|nr:hypothetical protein [Nocardioides sp.]